MMDTPFNRRIHNFGAGPSLLPEAVLRELQESLWNYQGTGMGIMEINHRSPIFDQILSELEERFRTLLRLPSSKNILFLPGGASYQFAMIPLHLLAGAPAGFVHTGHWTQKAMDEAKRVGEICVVASSEKEKFYSLPSVENLETSPSLSYLHYCSNNTIEGTQWNSFKKKTNTALVIDMSSDFLSRDLDWSSFDLVFAGLQKNLGAASLSISVAEKYLFETKPKLTLPHFLHWSEHLAAGSRLNTPHTLGLYLALLMLRWIESSGGISSIEKRNQQKADEFYHFIDSSSLFWAPVQKEDRSRMNLVFDLRETNLALSQRLLKEANTAGFAALEGHRVRGGFRASFYNSQSLESVRELIQFLTEFERRA
jgi:phosphoserine aminotransferase